MQARKSPDTSVAFAVSEQESKLEVGFSVVDKLVLVAELDAKTGVGADGREAEVGQAAPIVGPIVPFHN